VIEDELTAWRTFLIRSGDPKRVATFLLFKNGKYWQKIP
jgi:hypothetical protein